MSRQTLQNSLAPVQSSPGVNMGAGDWLQLEYVLYKDNKGIQRKWERCIRRKERATDVDGNMAMLLRFPISYLMYLTILRTQQL